MGYSGIYCNRFKGKPIVLNQCGKAVDIVPDLKVSPSMGYSGRHCNRFEGKPIVLNQWGIVVYIVTDLKVNPSSKTNWV